MMRGRPAWLGPPLALQILALLLGGLVVAQFVTLLLTLLVPPEPTPEYDLNDIARVLGGAKPRTATTRPLERAVKSGPPEPTGPGWLTSEKSRSELAGLLGREVSEVRLYFYTPLPFAGTAQSPAREGTSATPLPPFQAKAITGTPRSMAVHYGREATSAAPVQPFQTLDDIASPRFLPVQYRVAQGGPGPGGGAPGGGFPGPRTPDGAPGGGFPGGFPDRGPQSAFPPPPPPASPSPSQGGKDAGAASRNAPLASPPQSGMDAGAASRNAPIGSPSSPSGMDAGAASRNAPLASPSSPFGMDPGAASRNAPITSQPSQFGTDPAAAFRNAPITSPPSQSQPAERGSTVPSGPASAPHPYSADMPGGFGASARPPAEGSKPNASTTPPREMPSKAAAPVEPAAKGAPLPASPPRQSEKALDARTEGSALRPSGPNVPSAEPNTERIPRYPQSTVEPDARPGAARRDVLTDSPSVATPAIPAPSSSVPPPGKSASQRPGTAENGERAARGSALFGLMPAPFVHGDFIAALRLTATEWAVVQPAPEPFPNSWQRRVLLWFLLSFAIVAPLGWLFSRRIVRPIAAFARTAEHIGRDPTAPILPLSGPAEIGRAAGAFNRMQSRLRSFVAARTAMVGAISHDLRTPLTRMRFRLEDVPEELRAGILDDVDEMEQMINSVLAFIRDASEPGSRERLDLRSIVEDVVEDAVFVGKDVTLEQAEPAPVEVDAMGLRRVLVNLVENAVKYGDSARVRLFTDQQEAVTEVRDKGTGLPEEELERVFQPFYRTANARASNKQGTGLGLAVCRSIARAHGGDVQLMRGEEGLVAQVRLPLAYSEAA